MCIYAICKCVCMQICTCKWVYVNLCRCICINMLIGVYVCYFQVDLYIDKYVNIHTYIHTYLPTYLPTSLPACMHTYIHTYTYVDLYLNMHFAVVCMQKCMNKGHAHMRVHVYTCLGKGFAEKFPLHRFFTNSAGTANTIRQWKIPQRNTGRICKRTVIYRKTSKKRSTKEMNSKGTAEERKEP